MTVSQVLGFQAPQRFDITALVFDASNETREIGPGRLAFNISLMDNSKIDDKTLELGVTLFYNGKPNEGLHAEMLAREKSDSALTFFALQDKRVKNGYSIESTWGFFYREASGTKAANLKEAAATLYSLPQESRQLIQAA